MIVVVTTPAIEISVNGTISVVVKNTRSKVICASDTNFPSFTN